VGASGPPTAPGPREDIGPGPGAYGPSGPIGPLHTGTSTVPYPHRPFRDPALIVTGPCRPSSSPPPRRNEPEKPLGFRAPRRADRVHRPHSLRAARRLVAGPVLPAFLDRRAHGGHPAHRTDLGRRAATVHAPAARPAHRSEPRLPRTRGLPPRLHQVPASRHEGPPRRRDRGGRGARPGDPDPGAAAFRGGGRWRAGPASVPSEGIDTFDRSDKEGDRA